MSRNKLFNSVRYTRPTKNKFDLSHERKFSFNMGDLVPIMCEEVVPGDQFRVNTEVFMRLAPMLAPMMHRVNVRTEFFFVPNRLVWNEWEDFITGGRLGTSNPVLPYLTVDETNRAFFERGKLPDYLGIPPTDAAASIAHSQNISALPFRAYQLIWNSYYRDQNVSAPLSFRLDSGYNGDENDVLTIMRKRAWEKDYFTSALPFSQRGGDVSLPVEMDAGDITYRDPALVTFGGVAVPNQDLQSNDVLAPAEIVGQPSDAGALIDNIEDITSTSVTINALRQAVALQRWLEKNATGGARYVEHLWAHYAVRSDDARLQRPEYLGGGRQPVSVSEIVSTYQDDGGDLPQGNMAGHGISVGNQNGFKRSFKEHGYIIGLISVLPRTAYQQGIARHFQRFDNLEFYNPEFAHLGEQAILDRELLMDYETSPGQDTFGYQSRFCEYKYQQDSVHGEFRTSLAYWHMGRILPATPVLLNEQFIMSDPTHRVFAVTDPTIHKLYCQVYNKVDALRPMPYFGTPRL